ncbi:DUF6265 family protein [Pelagerythrobacter marensis]|uniref:DUF6265 family protein n=1 Tax=Pelagerythrobacter marensis TaxID=543877 RepID=UPI001FD08E90|nr:DUF6265 family protein [Pelagerythrobacter marensis]
MSIPAAAQETRVPPPDHVPPPASIGEVAWLAGDWTGSGIDGAPAAEMWLPPSGDTMVGLFVQENSAGGLMFTEHMYIAEENGSLVVKLKHFDPDLTGWEEKDDMVRFRLVSIEPCAVYFSALTYRCDGENGLVVAVRMKGADKDVNELVFRFVRRKAAAEAGPTP